MSFSDRLDELSYKLDRLIATRCSSSSSLLPQDYCVIESSPTHLVSECQFSGFEQNYQTQTQTAHHNYYTYDLDWRNHPNYSWTPQPVCDYEPSYPEEPYVAYQFQNVEQPSPITQNSAFEEQVLHMLKGLEIDSEILHSHTQSIARLETQIGQLTAEFSRMEEEDLATQPISNPRGQHMAEDSNAYEIFLEQPNKLVEVEVLNKERQEAIPNSQDSGRICWDPFGVDDFDIHGYTKDVHALLEPPNFNTTPSWTPTAVQISIQPSLPIAPVLESPPLPELKPSLVMSEYACLELKDTLPVLIPLDSSPNRITQLLKEQIGEILDTLGDIFYKGVASHLPEIGNPKPLEFVNPIFDTG